MRPSSRTPWSRRGSRGAAASTEASTWCSSTSKGSRRSTFLCYNARDPEERYHAPNTIKLQHNIYLGEGSVLWSVRGRRMMTIVEDTCGGHDTIFGCCSFELDDVRYGQRNPRACQQNFEQELARHGLGATAVVPNINFFMRVPVHADGSVDIVDGWSKPGDHVTLRAEMDILLPTAEALNPATGPQLRCGRFGIAAPEVTTTTITVGTIHAFALDLIKSEVPKYLKFEVLNASKDFSSIVTAGKAV